MEIFRNIRKGGSAVMQRLVYEEGEQRWKNEKVRNKGLLKQVSRDKGNEEERERERGSAAALGKHKEACGDRNVKWMLQRVSRDGEMKK